MTQTRARERPKATLPFVPPMTHKLCRAPGAHGPRGCGRLLPLEAFHVSGSASDGRQKVCINCHRAERSAKREKRGGPAPRRTSCTVCYDQPWRRKGLCAGCGCMEGPEL